jgi:uncharacterized protein YwgA
MLAWEEMDCKRTKSEYIDSTNRTSSEEMWDQIFLLNLFNCSSEPLDNLKIQKVIFVSENEARCAGLAAAHFPFFRYNLGPYSKVIANDVRRLQDLGFIDKETLQPSERGQYILEYVARLISQSESAKTALGVLQEVCRRYRDTKSSRLVNIVYAMKVPVFGLGGTVMQVKEIPAHIDIIDPSREGLADVSVFSDESLEDLKAEFELSAEELDPDNPTNVKLAREVLHRALA